jgi:hypothetical protein
MYIPDRVKQFIKHTNSFGVIVEEGKPTYIVASFDWAERILLGLEEETVEEANSNFSVVAGQNSEETEKAVEEDI